MEQQGEEVTFENTVGADLLQDYVLWDDIIFPRPWYVLGSYHNPLKLFGIDHNQVNHRPGT